MQHIATIYRLGVKELWSLVRDPTMLVVIDYMFTASIYVAATAMPETLHNAPIAIVDEDGSPLSARIVSTFYGPRFNPPALIPLSGVDAGMDAGDYTFALDIPPDFQRDVLAGKSPAIQLNVDATRMSQAFAGVSSKRARAFFARAGSAHCSMARCQSLTFPATTPCILLRP